MLLLPSLPVLVLCVVGISSSKSQTCEDALKTCPVIACGRDGRDGPKGEKGEPGMKHCTLAFCTFIFSGELFCVPSDGAQGPRKTWLSLWQVFFPSEWSLQFY